MLDPGTVPDLDWDRDAEYGRQDNQRKEPRILLWREKENARLAEMPAQRLADDLEADRRGKQNHDPVDLKPADQSPHVPVEIGEEQRREVPDRFLRANLAKAATRKPAADRKWKRDPFTGDEWRDSHDRPDDGTGVRAGKQAGEKGAGERQIGGVVVDEQPRDHA